MRGAVSQVEKVFSVINSTRLLLLLSALSVPPLWLCRAASTVGGEIAAIRPVEHPPRAAKPGGVVAVLNEPEMPVRGAKSSPRTIAKILSGAGIEVELLSAKQLADPDVLRPSAFDLVVLPTGQSFPAEARQAFVDFLHDGGGFISMGGYAFSNLLLEHDGKWADAANVMEARIKDLIAQGQSLLPDGGFESAADIAKGAAAGDGRWRRMGRQCAIVAESPKEGKHCAKVTAPPGDDKPAEFYLDLPAMLPAVYHVSGWLKTAGVVSEGGSKRLARIAVYQFNGENRLVDWKDFAAVGGTADWQQFSFLFSPDRTVTRIHIKCGLYLAAGTAWFDDIRLVRIPGGRIGPMNTAEGGAANKLIIGPEQIGVFDASFPLKRACLLRSAAGQHVIREPIERDGELAGWAASGIVGSPENSGYTTLDAKLTANARWTPLLQTLDRYGRPRGAAAAMLLNYDGFYAGSNWAYFGIENLDLFQEPAGPMARALQAIARFLVRGVYLRNLMTDHRLYCAGESVKAAVIVENRGAHRQSVRVDFAGAALETDEPAMTCTKELVVEPGNAQRVEAALGPVKGHADRWQVAATLRAGGETIDELVTGYVVDRPEIVQSGAALRFVDNYFTLNGRPMFLFGSDESAHVYLAPQENPLTWSEDLLAARDIGLNVYENLHYSCPNYALTENDWRDFRAMRQLTQKYNLVFMPGMLIKGDVAADAATLARQNEQCEEYAKRLGDTPGYIYYVNGDCEIHLDRNREDINARWNAYLKGRYQTTDRLRAAWGAEAVQGELGHLVFPPAKSDRWDDVAAVDEFRFRTEINRSWNQSHVDAVRRHDTVHPITSETWEGASLSGRDVRMTIDGQDLANLNGCEALSLRWFDLRARGKGVSIGEYGMRLHPAWTGEGGPSRGYSMARSEEQIAQLYHGVAHESLGLGLSRLQNWCLRDAQARSVFPWGIFYPEELIPKDVAYVHRNQSVIWRHFTPRYVPSRLTVCIANNMLLGNQPKLGMAAVYGSFGALSDLHYDFNVIGDHYLDHLPAATEALIYPAPLAIRDDVYARLLSWVKSGGKLLITGDISYDEDRQRTRSDRLKELAGVVFVAENYPDVQRDSGKDAGAAFSLPGLTPSPVRPCIRVKLRGADPLGQTAQGEPVLVRNAVGRGEVYYLSDPAELAPATDSPGICRQLYAAFLRAAGIQPLGVQPNEPWLHVMAQATSGGLVHVIGNTKTEPGREDVRIPTSAGELALTVRNGWHALAAVTGKGRIVAVSVDGMARVGGDEKLVAGAGLKALLSLDGQDLRQSKAVLLAPFEPGCAELPASATPRLAVVGEFRNGRWTELERLVLDKDSASINIDADRATCLILICQPEEAALRADHLGMAIIHPERIAGY
jgi:hypothetical protein